ncbi:hypothetical protein GGF50DRAFT_26629, partial [Schizophyllum commune]
QSRLALKPSPSSVRRKIMSSSYLCVLPCSHGRHPDCKHNEFLVARGIYQTLEGKVTQVYRKKWVIH